MQFNGSPWLSPLPLNQVDGYKSTTPIKYVTKKQNCYSTIVEKSVEHTMHGLFL